jgi:hypothetical protein
MCADTFWVSHEIMLAEKDDLDDFVLAVSRVCSEVDDLAERELS